MTEPRHPFEALTPSFIIDAVESQGFVCDCRTLALNSYENRVYQVGIEEEAPLIAKFYRPGRWSNEQIAEEHQFCFELADQELPVVAPLRRDGASLFEFGGFRFALYPRQGGHAPELDDLGNLLILGRLLGRLHCLGATRPFAHRPRLDVASFGRQSVELIRERFVPADLRANYEALTTDLLATVDAVVQAVNAPGIRVHGDLHAGNILWRHGAPHLVDLDDARLAPAVQDFWMLLCGDRPRRLAQLATLVDGYEEFFSFNPRELQLIEALRSLRLLHFSAWLASRWEDPTFPRHFPWFNTPRYWGEQILELREQIAALAEPALELP
ncbi:MAG: serine/threonine protein kinase [Desulfuromonadales bacterium]|nr:serine/threonine protein kinase [Desulfuromonadales bacterium]